MTKKINLLAVMLFCIAVVAIASQGFAYGQWTSALPWFRPAQPINGWLPISPVSPLIKPKPIKDDSGFRFAIEGGGALTRNQIQFGEAWSGTCRVTQPMAQIAMIIGPLKATALWSPKWHYQETFTPTGDFFVSGTNFGKVSDTQKMRQPVSLSWTSGDYAMVKVSTAKGALRPTVEIQLYGLNLEATGKVDDKPVTATQSWRATLWSAGATYVAAYQGLSVEVCGLAGSNTGHASGLVAYRLTDSGLLGTVGLRWDEVRIGELKNRATRLTLGIAKEW